MEIIIEMSQKKTTKTKTARTGNQGPSTWMVIAIIAIIFCVGLIIKTVYSPSQTSTRSSVSSQRDGSGGSWDPSLDSKKVQLVAAQFKCACGGCGELPLDTCRCEMERGAKEEKTFIRDKLIEGLTIAQVADLVEKEYGLRKN